MISVSRSPCSLFFFLPPFPLQEYRVQCATQDFRRSSSPGFSKHGAQAVPRSTGLRPHFSLLPAGALLRIDGSPEGCIAHIVSFSRIEIRLRETRYIPLQRKIPTIERVHLRYFHLLNAGKYLGSLEAGWPTSRAYVVKGIDAE